MSSWTFPTLVLTTLFIGGHIAFTVWVTIGGWFDLIKLLSDLNDEQIDPGDDGSVRPDSN
jgi:hypothetical protein